MKMKQLFLTIAVCSVLAATNSLAANAEKLIEKTSCGKASNGLGWWPNNAPFAYEIMDKRAKKKGYKVKVWGKSGNKYIHLDCARDLPSVNAAHKWLSDRGYEIQPEGPEGNFESGSSKKKELHITADKGPISNVPYYVYE
jgi:hypothetical protein